MTTISPANLLKLRDSHPHASKFYMTVFSPACVYTGQVAGTPTRGDRYITVTNISGSISSLQEGYTVYVKNADGVIVSKRRYRSRSGQVLKLDENTVAWSTAYTVEVYNSRELWTVFPYVTTDNYIFYKDYDISYSSQNDFIPPVAIAGSTKVGFLDGASITFTLDGSDSYALAVGATISSYLWTCAGGTIASNTSASTTVTFTAVGEYTLSLTVTDSNNMTQTTYRMIRVHSRTGSDAPITNFELESISGSWSDGGFTTAVISRDSNLEKVFQGTHVVIWTESWFDNTLEYVDEFGNIKFDGYVLSDSTTKTLDSNEVSFDLGTVQALMKQMRMFSVSLEAVVSGNAAVTWYQFPYGTLTVARAVHHLWKWHSTLFDIADVFLPTSNTEIMSACDDMSDGNLYTLLDWVYNNGIFAKVVCDQSGRVHVIKDPLIMRDEDRELLDTVMEITDKDRRAEDDLSVTRYKESQAAVVVASGIGFVSSEFTPMISQAPGAIPENFGDDTINIERLVLSTQVQLNEISGRLYAIANSEISEIRLSFSGDYPVNITAQSWYTMTIPASYTKRNIEIDVRMICREVTFNISIANGTMYPTCVFDVDVDSVDGVTIDYVEETETPYSPVPPYTPYVPYIPGITPIYPIVPVQPYPYPSGAPTTLPAQDSIIPVIDPYCPTDDDYPANGPYSLGMSGTVVESAYRNVKFFMRSTSATNRTRYTLNGTFYDVNPLTGNYIEVTGGDPVYTVYGLNCAGVRVATGIEDYISADGHQRGGYFAPPAGVNICSIEVAINKRTGTTTTCGVGALECQPPVYGSYTPGVFAASYGAGALAIQYSNFQLNISNPPWTWSGDLRFDFYWYFDIEDYPQWVSFNLDAYSSSDNVNSMVHWTSGPYNGSIQNTADGLNHSGKVKTNSEVVGGSGFWFHIKKDFSGPLSPNPGWLTVLGSATPIYPKVVLTSALLWNVCSYV